MSCAAPLEAGEASSPSQTTPPPQPAPALPSSFASGRYQVRRFLGEGGKKRVYLARDARLDREVAIAVIKTEGLDEAGHARVKREAESMGRLGSHANIVTVHDIGDEAPAGSQTSRPYIILEFMEGGSLEDQLAAAAGHRLPLDRALAISEQLCGALEHAHSQAIIHRDLKPGNIWFTADGTVKLGDFGLAVAVDRSRLTREGMMVGTTAYMPPEQAVGGEAAPRSDLYALGCVLYEMVAGRPPFLGDDSVAVVSQHINTAPVAPTWHNPEVPRPLELLIIGLLAKAPEERPESAGDVAQEIRRIRDRTTEEVAAGPVTPATELRGMAWGQFVGRHAEMDQLKAALEESLSAHGNMVMLVGEPGIGKTRLAEEFGVYARLRGAQVLTGRCYEGEVALPYRPFVEAFRKYVGDRPDAELRGELGQGAPEVAKLVSEVRQRFPDIQEATPLEADAERLRLFESVSAFVRNAAAANPMVIFLDDIHWADKPSLLMLRYLARAVAGQRVLVLAAYRDVELDRTHPLSEVIATLRREQPYQRVLLRGLPENDVLALLSMLEPSEDASGGREALAAALYQETEGNPFFIREVISHLVEEEKLVREDGHWTSKVTSVSELGIPEGVREVIGRRLSRVSEGCNRMLTLASTMTGGFSWEELKALSEEGEAALLDLLDEALAAQLVQERKGDHAGSYDFTHALIRQTLYGELSTPRRVILHRRIGEALEGLHKDNLDPHLSELAHHFYQAAPGGDVDKAIGYATHAGDRAVDQLAYEEAAAHYELAVQALDLKERVETRQRYDLLEALGNAYYRSDLPEKAMEATERAVGLAEELGDPQLRGRAALAYSQAVARGPLAFTQADVPTLERALEVLGKEESGLRARLLAGLSVALAEPPRGLGPRERRQELAEEAKELAERVQDLGAQGAAIDALHGSLMGPEWTKDRLVVATKQVEVAEKSGEPAAVLFARQWRILALAELGEMDEVDREVAVFVDMADRMREPAWSSYRSVWGAMRALMQGRFEEAERLIVHALPIAQRMQHPAFLASIRAQVYNLRTAQGRLAELEQITLQNSEADPSVIVGKAALAYLYQQTDRPNQAHEWFERLAENEFTDVPRDFNFLVTMLLSADVARRLGDVDRAALLYEMLRPYANRNVVVGVAALCDGSASRPLGQLAATMRRWDDAEGHFEDAVVFDEKIGAWAWLARTRYEYADMLRERDQAGDREKAQELVNQALATFEELGMPNDVNRALALKMELQGVAYGDVKTSIDAVSSAAQSERPDLAPHAAPDGTVTLLFTDIVDSTPLNERLGDQRWMALLREHNAIVREQVGAHGGFEVKAQGDGFMVAFGSARKALQCAIAVQQAMAQRNESSEEPVIVRIGLHTGEAVKEADDFFGRHVNLAARIAGKAAGGEVLVSSLLRELTDSAGDIAFGEGRDVELKGLTGTQRVYSVGWEQG